ncbi:MAG: hypothetical protein JNJ48_01165 [Phycisphaerae bacterium]|nr:hypothetical protein [Phycisphaerae bacterium]
MTISSPQFALEQTQRWTASAEAMLEEHHLAAWTRNLAAAERFSLHLGRHLRGMADTEVWPIPGAVVRTLEAFCHHLERALPRGERVRPTIEGRGGVVERLRERYDEPGASPTKRRYYLWRDADVLLRHDAGLFGTLVEAMAGVAAEAEYAGEDLLLIHRAVFVGGPALDLYHEDRRGQFRRWLRDAPGQPLWRVISGLKRPPVAVYEIR